MPPPILPSPSPSLLPSPSPFHPYPNPTKPTQKSNHLTYPLIPPYTKSPSKTPDEDCD